MKNIQKTFAVGLGLTTLFLSSFASADIVTSQTHSSLYAGDTQCDGGTFDQVMYAGSSRHEMIDTFTENNTSYVWQFNSQNTYVSTYNAIPNAITMPTLSYFSNGKPHNVTSVVVMGTKEGATIASDIPSTYKRSDIAAQVVYHVTRTRFLYKEGTAQTMSYLDFNNLGAGTQTYSYMTNGGRLTKSDNECLNIHIGYCGDGILDNGTDNYSTNINAPLNGGEECDPNDSSRTGWGDGGCSASCKPIENPKVQPKCVSSYEGSHYNTKYPTAYLNADMTLCNPGEVANFVGPIEPGRTYTWKCNGAAGTTPDECDAKELWCGDGKLQKDYEDCDYNDSTHEGWGDQECDTSCKLTDKKVYDLALTKTLDENKTSYKLGDTVYYRITIYNQGDYTAKNIEITDYIPDGLILDDGKWTQVGSKATRLIEDEILPGTSKSITITFKIDSNFKGTRIVNGAEISKDNSNDYDTDDIDSNPDKDPDDDCIVEYKHIIDGNGKAYSEDGKACDESTDEDDHDFVPIDLEAEEEPGEPTIDKELLGDKKHPYKVGELVGFKMVFKNTTDKVVTHAIIKDFLPLNLEYVSSEIHGVSPVQSGVYLASNGQIVLEYSGFDLAANQEGYLIMTGIVLSSNLDYRVNDVCIYGNGKVESYKCAQAEYLRNGIKIEKTVSKKEVSLGDEIVYTIKITALDGEYTGYTIRDVLPKGIAFVSYDLNSASSTTKYSESFSTGLTSTGLDIMLRNYTFENGFKKGDTLTIKFKAKVVELYKKISTNVACILPPGEDEICDSEDVVLTTIKKYVSDSVDGPWYDTGMTLSNGKIAYFKIVVYGVDPLESFVLKDSLDNSKLLFKNESWSLANNAFTGVIKFGSKNTGEKEYKITPRVNNAVTGTTQLSWDVFMSKGQFMSGDTFETIFMAEKKADETNTACVYYDLAGEETYDCDPAEVKNPTGDVITIKKDVSKSFDKDYKAADTSSDSLSLDTTTNEKAVFFKITVSDAKIPFTGFKVKDSLDASKYKLLKTDTLALANNSFTGKLEKGSKNTGQFTYIIIPKISNDDKDIEWTIEMTSGSVFMEGDTFIAYFKAEKLRNDNEENTACVYDYLGNTKYGCNPAYVKRECLTSCGGGGHSSGGGGGGGSKCGDGKKNGIEYCDWGTDAPKVIGSDGKLFKNSDVVDKNYEGWTCTSSCTLKNESTGESPKCFNVQNGSISIMIGEMLPFFWNMQAVLGDVSQNPKYLVENFVAKCDGEKTAKHVDLSTMMCNFIIRGPRDDNGVDTVYKTSIKCVDFNGWGNGKTYYKSIQDFIEQNKKGWFGGSELYQDGNIQNVFDSLDNWEEYPVFYPISSKAIITNFGEKNPSIINASSSDVIINRSYKGLNSDGTLKYFGEYKISLDSVDYNICNGDADKFEHYHAGGVDEPVCEVDFAVTNPYLVQKSPYGSIASSTSLSMYKNKNGGALFEGNDEKKAVDYSVPADLASTLKTFISKYYVNSVVVKDSSACGSTIKKVQGKSIYFIDGNSDIDLTACIKETNKPFTLVAKDGANIIIKGSLYTNAMIMTSGKIIFDAQGFKVGGACNGDLMRYGHAGQMVRGIFYAGAGFDSRNDIKNTNVQNEEWCNYGNIHIKGVAIGNLQSVLNNRRSELYTWFHKGCHQKNPSNCSSRKDVVLNGASVLIEYNPDLWGNLPPGAEEFNKALEVYRK